MPGFGDHDLLALLGGSVSYDHDETRTFAALYNVTFYGITAKQRH